MEVGEARVEIQEAAVAGSYQTVHWIYEVGHPIDDGGHLLIAFRHCGDFARPQFHAPSAPNYCTVETTGDCIIEPTWEKKGHIRPWTQCVRLAICHGFLDTGDQVRVVFGDKSRGSAGWRLQTFSERAFQFKTFVDPIGTQSYKEMAHSPALCIVPGTAARCSCIGPSCILVGEAFSYYVRREDPWGNAVSPPERFVHPGFPAEGIQRILHHDDLLEEDVASNPMKVTHAGAQCHRWWADLHGQSEETVGTNSIDDYYVAGRDFARLDAISHQGNDFQISDALWKTIGEAADRYNEPGAYVTFPGYEWSGNTPLGGDRNVYYVSSGGGIYRSSLELVPGGESRFPVASTAQALFQMLREHHGEDGCRPFVFAHVGGRHADLSMHDAALELAVEVHSAWGTFEWLLQDALRLGYRVGVVANSDDHRGTPGASYPGAEDFGSLGGLTCILSERLDRESILQALMQRHMYATTGNRSLLDVSLHTSDGRCAMMGDVLRLEDASATLRVHAAGTASIERVDVIRCGTVLHVHMPPVSDRSGRRIKIAWRGAERRGRSRAACWDGGVTVRRNTIADVSPVNFWNPERPVRRQGPAAVEWESATTGGVSGIILTLAHTADSRFQLVTEQARRTFGSTQLLRSPVGLRWKLGEVGKNLTAVCLPDRGGPLNVEFEIELKDLAPGDNPIYVRVMQEDGHFAWSSPIYVVQDR